MKIEIVILIFISNILFCQFDVKTTNHFINTSSTNDTETTYQIEDIDSIPQFSNRDIKNIKQAIQFETMNLIHYPQEAIDYDIHGKVYLTFEIDSIGIISNITIVRGVHKLIDDEAISTISKMNVTRPAMLNGKKVNVLVYTDVAFYI